MNKQLLVFLTISGLLLACATEQKQAETQQVSPVASFTGKAIYQVEAISDKPHDISIFYRFNPSVIEIGFGDSVVRILETGGSSGGNVLIDLRQTAAWQIDTIDKVVYQGNYSDLSDAPPALKATMPDHFQPVLHSTGEQKMIGNWNCTKYEVIRSCFIRPGVPTTAWITNDILLPGCRYDVETDVNMVSAPLPLYMGVAEGTVVVLEYATDGLLVRYLLDTVESLPTDDNFFQLPTTYRFQ